MSGPPEILAVEEAARSKVDVVLALFREVLSGERDVAKVDALLSPEYVDHDPAAGDDGRAGVAAKLQGMWDLLPNGSFVPEIVVAAGDVVSVRSRLVSGSAEVAFADVYRVRDGLICEHWHVFDTAALTTLVVASADAARG
jgi:predicted SnoaL-like aldol condensation-catalyzing enzyme